MAAVCMFLVCSCMAAPLSSAMERDQRSIDKFTCKHRSEGLIKNWKQCSNTGADILNLRDMQIPRAVSRNQISALNIPVK